MGEEAESLENIQNVPSLHVYSASFTKEKADNAFAFNSNVNLQRPQSANFTKSANAFSPNSFDDESFDENASIASELVNNRALIRQLSDNKDGKKRASHLPRPPIRRSISKSLQSKTAETLIVPSTPNQVHYSDDESESSLETKPKPKP